MTHVGRVISVLLPDSNRVLVYICTTVVISSVYRAFVRDIRLLLGIMKRNNRFL